MATFSTVKQQAALKARKPPYWQRIGVGKHIGVRKGGTGLRWQAKAYDAGSQKEAVKALGSLDHLPQSERYSAAISAAMEWFDHLGKGGRHDALTVAQAWRRYQTHQQKEKGAAAAADVAARLKRHIVGDAIANVQVDKLTKRHLQEWRARISVKPAAQPKRGPNCRVKSAPPPATVKSASTANRDLVAMRAALNLAKDDGFVTSDLAWKRALKPAKNADGRRTLYLDRDQRRALIEKLPKDAAAFARGLCLLPLRPGALAALTVSDFDARQGTLRVGVDKAGEGRTVLLPAATASLLKKQAKDKLPAAPLLSRSNGSHWSKDAWKLPIRAAADAAELPARTTAYTLRHSVITDLVAAGLDLFTVAALAGTSIAMIERHYGQLQQTLARDALAGLAL